MAGKQSLSPAGHPVTSWSESAGQELLVQRPPLGCTMSSVQVPFLRIRVPLPEGSEHLVPGTPNCAHWPRKYFTIVPAGAGLKRPSSIRGAEPEGTRSRAGLRRSAAGAAGPTLHSARPTSHRRLPLHEELSPLWEFRSTCFRVIFEVCRELIEDTCWVGKGGKSTRVSFTHHFVIIIRNITYIVALAKKGTLSINSTLFSM